jgi:hypothetical protein
MFNSNLWKNLEEYISGLRKEADAACVCKFCGNKKKKQEYRPDNNYRCHGCAAPWPTLFKNYFWVERHKGLYDDLDPSYLKRSHTNSSGSR